MSYDKIAASVFCAVALICTGGCPPKETVDDDASGGPLDSAISSLANREISVATAADNLRDAVNGIFETSGSPDDAIAQIDQILANSIDSESMLTAFDSANRALGGTSYEVPVVGSTSKSMHTMASSSQCTTVIYVNGINTTYSAFVGSLVKLDLLAREVLPDARVMGVYNTSATDAERSIFGALICPALDLAFPLFISSRSCGSFVDLAEASTQFFNLWAVMGRDATPGIGQATQVRNALERELNAGRNVILVCHSQGNFFVRDALRQLGSDDGSAGSPFAAVGVLMVASPETSQYMRARFTSRVDICGDAVAAFGNPTLPGCVSNTRTDCPLARVNPFCAHSFDFAYLAGDARARIRSALQTLNGQILNSTACGGTPGGSGAGGGGTDGGGGGRTATDSDGDGVPDAQDGCPNDRNKTSPGNCGCGSPEVPDCGGAVQDSDGDGVPDPEDGCPDDRNKTFPGNCGCGNAETPGCGAPSTSGSVVAWGRNDYGQCNVPAPNSGFIAIAAGGYHSLGLRADGSIVAWGFNGAGQCDVPSPNSGFAAVAAGTFHSLALRGDGSIVAWGSDTYGEGSPPSTNNNFAAIAAGDDHSLALRRDGTIVAWGQNDRGQCNVPAPNSDWVAIAAWDDYSIALKSDGRVFYFSTGGGGEVPTDPSSVVFDIAQGGYGYVGLAIKTNGSVEVLGCSSDPHYCIVPPPNSQFIAAAGGPTHKLLLRENGSIVAWGTNAEGQCDVPAPNSQYVGIAAGGEFSLGLRRDGAPPAEPPDVPAAPSPASGATDVSIEADLDWADAARATSYDVYFGPTNPPTTKVGNTASSDWPLGTMSYQTTYYWKIVTKNGAGSTDGPVWSFATAQQPLHPPDVPAAPSPANGATDVSIEADLDWADAARATSYDVYFGPTNPPTTKVGNTASSDWPLGTLNYETTYYWKIVAENSAGSTPGPVWSFTTAQQSPDAPSTPSPSDGASNISVEADLDWADAVRATSYDVYFGTTNPPPFAGSATASVWTLGTLDYETTYYWKIVATNSAGSTAGPVWSFTTEAQIVAWGAGACGQSGYGHHGQACVPAPNRGFIAVAAGDWHSLGLRANGSIVAWGDNSGGQCDVPSPNTGFVAVAAGVGHSLGLKADGSIVAWGDNLFGQLNVPAPNTNFVAVAAGEGHSLGLKADGSIRAWGLNTGGQLNVPSPNTDFVAVAAGDVHSLGLKVDGSIRAWGVNSDGQCNVPSPNAGFTTVVAGNRHSLGLKADGSIRAWGLNEHGQCIVPSPNAGFVDIAAGKYHSLAIRFDGSIVVWGSDVFDQLTVPSPNTGFVAVAGGVFHSLGLRGD